MTDIKYLYDEKERSERELYLLNKEYDILNNAPLVDFAKAENPNYAKTDAYLEIVKERTVSLTSRKMDAQKIEIEQYNEMIAKELEPVEEDEEEVVVETPTPTVDIKAEIAKQFDSFVSNFEDKQVMEEAERIKASQDAKAKKDTATNTIKSLIDDATSKYETELNKNRSETEKLRAETLELRDKLKSFKTKSLSQETNKGGDNANQEVDVNDLWNEKLDNTGFFL